MMALTALHSPLKSRSNFPIRRGRTATPRRAPRRGWVLSACAIFPVSPVRELCGNWDRRGGVQVSVRPTQPLQTSRSGRCSLWKRTLAVWGGRGCSRGHVQTGQLSRWTLGLMTRPSASAASCARHGSMTSHTHTRVFRQRNALNTPVWNCIFKVCLSWVSPDRWIGGSAFQLSFYPSTAGRRRI